MIGWYQIHFIFALSTRTGSQAEGQDRALSTRREGGPLCPVPVPDCTWSGTGTGQALLGCQSCRKGLNMSPEGSMAGLRKCSLKLLWGGELGIWGAFSVGNWGWGVRGLEIVMDIECRPRGKLYASHLLTMHRKMGTLTLLPYLRSNEAHTNWPVYLIWEETHPN